MDFQTYSQFLNYIESNYDEEQQIIIESFISYYINKYRKIGKYNCKDIYYDDLHLWTFKTPIIYKKN